MTRKRNDDHSTEFGLWVRNVWILDSFWGYIATNLDFIWTNYKNGKWMLLEEKRYMSEMRYAQKRQYQTLHNSIQDKYYQGFYLIQFENTNPEDGKIFINGIEASKQDFIDFLAFKKKYETFKF